MQFLFNSLKVREKAIRIVKLLDELLTLILDVITNLQQFLNQELVLTFTLQKVPFFVGQMDQFCLDRAFYMLKIFTLHSLAIVIHKVEFKLLTNLMHLLKGRFHLISCLLLF